MNAVLAIRSTGLVTSVGSDTRSSCAAMRAKLTNPCATHFLDASGEWIIGHAVVLSRPWRGLARLARMAALAIEEALQGVPRPDWQRIPMLLCVAEPERPGRVEDLDGRLFPEIQRALATNFAGSSAVVSKGRVSVPFALSHARTLLSAGAAHILVVAVDSLLSWSTLNHYEQRDRLLTARNSNGFIPGEGAGAVLVSGGGTAGLQCAGMGFGMEPSPVDAETPLRAEGLTQAIRGAIADAGCEMHDFDYRIADISGEQYYFKEAALALARTLRRRKAEFDLWHPAEYVGEAGALAGVVMLALADAAARGGFAPGPCVLAHMGNDAGERAALALFYRGDTHEQ
jgi:3-oxoacyl-[acyl-carrier-protein] synthase I